MSNKTIKITIKKSNVKQEREFTAHKKKKRLFLVDTQISIGYQRVSWKKTAQVRVL